MTELIETTFGILIVIAFIVMCIVGYRWAENATDDFGSYCYEVQPPREKIHES